MKRRQTMRPEQEIIWKNVHARYPGFTEEVSNEFWRLENSRSSEGKKNECVKLSSDEFVRKILAEFPEGINVTDVKTQSSSVSNNTVVDFEKIKKWALDVYHYHDVIDNYINGKYIIPLEKISQNDLLHSKIRNLEEKNAALKVELDKALDTNKSADLSIGSMSSKRRSSLYKLIIGMAKDKFDYEAKPRKAVGAIKSALERVDINLSDDTIRSVLEEADEFLEI